MYEQNNQNRYEPAAEPEQSPKKPNRMAVKLTAAAVAVALAAGAAGGAVGYSLSGRDTPQPAAAETTVQSAPAGTGANAAALTSNGLDLAPAHDDLLSPAEVYEQNVNAVVAVSTEGVTTNSWGQTSRFASSGSGFLITADGYIVTNHHVIDDATSINVILTSGETVEAELVGSDEENDVALLKIDGQNLPTVSLGDSESLRVGDQVTAIGNPLGELTNTLTVGYISALDREINTDGAPINMLQTDAAINSGNSGGPLFDMYGNVIGITTAKYASSRIEGLGFAVPINDAMYIVYDLIEYGYVTSRPWMGVSVRDMDSVTASYYSLPVVVYDGEVTESGAAERAGVAAGDIIIGLGDREITCYTELSAALKGYKAGETASLTVYRAGAELELEITFDERIPEVETEAESAQEQTPEERLPGGSWSFGGTMPGNSGTEH